MYDNTCRFLAENFSADFASWLMGEAIILTEIEPSELSLDPIRADALIRLWEQPASLFLQYPGLLPFATLSDTPNPEATLRQVATVVNQISDPVLQANLFAASGILAGLRLEDTIIDLVLRRDIMEESSFYRSIVAEGAAKKQREIAINLLKAGLTVTLIASTTGFSIEEVQLLQQDLNSTSAA